MYYILSIIVIVIAVYGYWLRTQSKKFKNMSDADLMLYKFADCDGCDLWALSHVLLYMVLGYMYPNRLFILLILGILWEIFEVKIGKIKLEMLGFNVPDDEVIVKDGSIHWFFGRVTDIAFNLSGAIIGAEIAKYVK